MASQAKSFLVILIYWGVIGLLWAAFYDTIYTTIPNTFATAVAASSTTWEILKWIWLIGMPIIALGTGLAAVNQRNQFSFGHALVMNAAAFIIWFLTIFFWAALYEPFLITIPTAMNTAFNYSGDLGWITTLYNSAAVLLMIGFGIIGVSDSS